MLSPELQRLVEEGAQRYRRPDQPETPSKFDEDLEFLTELEPAKPPCLKIELQLRPGSACTITVKAD